MKNKASKPNEKHDNALLSEIKQEIEDAVENMDTDFPLSGGVEHPVHHHHKSDNDAKKDKKDDHRVHTSFKEDLETEFPLSGGEVER